MKRILLAPSLIVALGVSGGLLAQGSGGFSSSSSLSFSATVDGASVALGDRVVVT